MQQKYNPVSISVVMVVVDALVDDELKPQKETAGDLSWVIHASSGMKRSCGGCVMSSLRIYATRGAVGEKGKLSQRYLRYKLEGY